MNCFVFTPFTIQKLSSEEISSSDESTIYDRQHVHQQSSQTIATLAEESNEKLTERTEARPTENISRKEVFAVGCILVSELCERVAFYGTVANMVLFCTSKLEMSVDRASIVTLVFTGTVYVMTFIGGFISDAWLGKYNTIFGAGLLYIPGLFLLLACAVNYKGWPIKGENLSLDARRTYFFIALVFIVLGTGGIKANIGPFGAQQIDHLGEKMVQSYFNWYYWFINLGALISYSGVAYVQQEHGFEYGNLIPLVSMLIAIAILVSARSMYRGTEPGGADLKAAIAICVSSISGWKRPSLRHARREYGGKYDNKMVDGVKGTISTFPIFLLFIVYWAVYAQMYTSLFLQTERMNVSIGHMRLSAALMNTFNTFIILVLVPIMEKCIWPVLEKYGKSPTNLQKIGIGMILAVLAMLYSALIEIIRKEDISKNGYISQKLSDDYFNASKISMFAQIPEFALIGSSEVFTSISGLEFAYTQAPKSMQGVMMGIYSTTVGLGSYLASLIVFVVKSWKRSDASDWFPVEPNNGHLEYLLFLLAALTFINLLLFIVVSRWYRRKKLRLSRSMEVLPNDSPVLN